jgi:hypothetical protein
LSFQPTFANKTIDTKFNISSALQIPNPQTITFPLITGNNLDSQKLHAPEITAVQEKDGKLYLKAFLIDSSKNKLGWGIRPDYLPKYIGTAIGKPAILNQTHYHPLEFNDIQEETVTSPEVAQRNIAKYLEAQKRYELFTIKSIEQASQGLENTDGYVAYLESTDPRIIDAYKNGTLKIPRYVSPSIYKKQPRDPRDAITEFEFLHLAFVDEPAFNAQVANIKGECLGTEQKCITQLAQASLFCSFKEMENVKNVLSASELANSSLVSKAIINEGITLTEENSNPISTSPNPNQQQTQTVAPTPVVEQPKPVQTEVVNKAPVQVPVVEKKEEKVESKTEDNNNEIKEQLKLALQKINELTEYKDNQIKNSEESKVKAKRELIESYVTKDTAESEEEWQRRINFLMATPLPHEELEHFLKIHYEMDTPCSQKGLKQASIPTPKRVTDFNKDKVEQKKSVESASLEDTTRAQRVMEFTSVISSNKSGGRYI